MHLSLTHYDLYIAGGIMPAAKKIELPNPSELKASFFLERRERGMINVEVAPHPALQFPNHFIPI